MAEERSPKASADSWAEGRSPDCPLVHFNKGTASVCELSDVTFQPCQSSGNAASGLHRLGGTCCLMIVPRLPCSPLLSSGKPGAPPVATLIITVHFVPSAKLARHSAALTTRQVSVVQVGCPCVTLDRSSLDACFPSHMLSHNVCFHGQPFAAALWAFD